MKILHLSTFICLLFLADAEGVKVRITPNKIKLEGQPGSIEQFTVIASNKEKLNFRHLCCH